MPITDAVIRALLIVGAARSSVAPHPTQVTEHELFSALELSRPGLERVQAAVAREDFEAAGLAWAAYLPNRERPTPHFSRETWADFVRREFPQLVDPIIAAADRVTEGHITHGPLQLPVENGEIQWLHNPDKDTNYVSLVGSQWFLNPLGRAYLLTGDDRYAATFARTYLRLTGYKLGLLLNFGQARLIDGLTRVVNDL